MVKNALLLVLLTACLAAFTGCGKNKIERSQEFVKQGLMKYKEGDFENAVVALNRALELNPGNAHAHYYLGAVYRKWEAKTDNTAAAIRELEQCIAKDVNYMDAYNLLASILINEQKFEEAEKVAKRAIKVQDDSAEPHYWMAQSYYQREMFEQAHAECKRAVRIDPSHAASRGLLRELNKILEY